MKYKVVLLITGQKSRLELKSKIKYILKSICNNTYDIVVVLSLSNTENFTNEYKYIEFKSESEFKSQYEEVENLLGLTPYYENEITYPDLNINYDILSMYDKRKFGETYLKNRARNHVRQYYCSSNSWEFIEKLDPDILIKIRDDIILYSPLKMDDIHKLLSNANAKSIVTPWKRAWGGINDKCAIVSKDAIETFLKKPFEVYNHYKKIDSKRLRNPEQFLSFVYEKNGIQMLTTNIDIKIMGTKKK